MKLHASDRHQLDMYVATPAGTPKGAIVVLQEIFGANAHIRSVCDRLAAAGYVAGAPALFDRLQPGYETGYTPSDVEQGKQMMQRFDFDTAELDIRAAVDAFADKGPVSIIGFCLGGSLAYKMATSGTRLAAAICYYGGMIAGMADADPKCPVMLHFGETDPSIPRENYETVRTKQPNLPLHVYHAGHGFNCDARSAYNPEAAALAWQRTMTFIAEAGSST